MNCQFHWIRRTPFRLRSVFTPPINAVFDHSHPQWPTEVVTLRLRAAIPVRRPEFVVVDAEGGPDASHALLGETTLTTDAGETAAPLYDRNALLIGNLITGPAVLTQTDCTTYVPPGVGWSRG